MFLTIKQCGGEDTKDIEIKPGHVTEYNFQLSEIIKSLIVRNIKKD